MWGMVHPCALLVGEKTGTATTEILKNLEIDLPYDLDIPFLDICPTTLLSTAETGSFVSVVTLFTTARACKHPGCSLTSEQIIKTRY